MTQVEIAFLFDTELLPFADVVELPTSKSEQRWSRDPEDDKFIRCAQAGKRVRFITGDDDLLSLKRVGKVSREQYAICIVCRIIVDILWVI